MAEEAVDRPRFFGPLLLARDFERTVAFYRIELGLPVEGAFPYAKVQASPSTLSIADGKWWAQINGSENPIQGESSVSDAVLMIQVPDVRELFDRLMVAGVKLLNVPVARRPLGLWNAFLRDPDGRTVMLTSPMK